MLDTKTERERGREREIERERERGREGGRDGERERERERERDALTIQSTAFGSRCQYGSRQVECRKPSLQHEIDAHIG